MIPVFAMHCCSKVVTKFVLVFSVSDKGLSCWYRGWVMPPPFSKDHIITWDDSTTEMKNFEQNIKLLGEVRQKSLRFHYDTDTG